MAKMQETYPSVTWVITPGTLPVMYWLRSLKLPFSFVPCSFETISYAE